jgi:hypothetical protein
MLMRCLELSRRTTALHLTDLNSTLYCIHTYIVVIIETIRSSETLGKSQKTMRRYNPEDILHIYRHDTLMLAIKK